MSNGWCWQRGRVMTHSLHPLWLVAASLVLALAPTLLGLVTSYVKVSIVLNLLKGGFGAQGVPGTIVVLSLSLALSLFIMGPTMEASLRAAESIESGKLFREPSIAALSKLAPIAEPWREFLEKHSGERERKAVLALRPEPSDSSKRTEGQADHLSWRHAMLAFLLTELREAFSMGFMLLLPFLVIDLIVANVFVGLGMFMVSPTMVSLPLKIILFVVADGWILLSRGLMHSYG